MSRIAKILLCVLALGGGLAVGVFLFDPFQPPQLDNPSPYDSSSRPEGLADGSRLPTWREEVQRRKTAEQEPAATDPEFDTPAPEDSRSSGDDESLDGVLRVKVVRENGDAVPELRVMLSVRPMPESQVSFDLGEAVSDVNGMANVPTERLESASLDQVPNAAFFLTCDLPGEDAPRVPIQPDATDGVFELVVPDHLIAWLEPLRVLVVDGNDRPLEGIRVEMRLERANAPDEDQGVARETTDENGLVEISREKQRERISKSSRFQVSWASWVTLAHPLADPPRARVDDPAVGLVKLVVLDTGSVRVSLRDASGTPVLDDAVARLRFREAGLPEGTQMTAWRRDVKMTDGALLFERIGLGLELGITAWRGDGGARAAYATVMGPALPGETVEVQMAFGEEWPWITGRVFDRDGEPLAGSRLPASTQLIRSTPKNRASGPDRPWYFKIQTDATGRFRYRMTGNVPEGAHRVLVLRRELRETPGGVPVFATTAIPDPLPSGGTFDLGDLRLAPEPLLISGRALDERGAPIRSAIVTIGYYTEGGNRGWSNLNTRSCSSDEYGRFELRYVDPPDNLQVNARRRMDLFASERFEAGATGVELVLRPSEAKREVVGRVQGVLVVDPEIALDHLEVVLRHESGKRRTANVLEHAGGFHFEVPPGRADLEVRTDPGGEVIARIEGLTIEADERCADPRLASVDVRGKVRYLRVRLIAPGGAPMANDNVWLRLDNSGGSVARTDDRGRLVLLVSADRGELELAGNGFSVVTPFVDDGRDLVVTRR